MGYSPSLPPSLPYHLAKLQAPSHTDGGVSSANATRDDVSEEKASKLGHKRKSSRQESLNKEWKNKRARQEALLSSPVAGMHLDTFIPSAAAQELIEEIRLIEGQKNTERVDYFTVVVKKITGEKIAFDGVDALNVMCSDEKMFLDGDDLLYALVELKQAIGWLEGSEDQAFAFNMVTGIVENMPSPTDRARGVEILVSCLGSIDRSCYPQTHLDETGDEDLLHAQPLLDEDQPPIDESLLRVQPLVGSLDRLIGIVEDLGGDNDAQARAGISVASTLNLPDRRTGNIERFTRMAEIFKDTQRDDLKVKGINALAEQVGSIITNDGDFLEQVLGDLGCVVESIDSIIKTIENPDTRTRVDEEVMPKLKASKKVWELTSEAREIVEEKSPTENIIQFGRIVAKLKGGEIPLHGNELLTVISELGDAIECLGIQHKALAFDMLAGIAENAPSSADRMECTETLVKWLLSVDKNTGDEEDSLHAQFFVGSVDRLIEVLQSFEENNDDQAGAGIAVALTLNLPARGTGNIERFIRMAEIFKGTQRDDLKVRGINTLVDQIDSIALDGKNSFTQVLANLDRATESIVSVIQSIEHPDEREQAGKEVMSKLKATKKAWELMHEARQITKMAQFGRAVEQLRDEEILLQGKHLFDVLSGLGDAAARLDGIRDKARALGMLGGIVEKISSSTDRVLGIEILTSTLFIISLSYEREDSTQSRQFLARFLDKLINVVEKFEKDNGDQARAGIAVLTGIDWPERMEGGIDCFVRMAAIFEQTGDQDLKMQGLEALVDQIGRVIESDEDVYDSDEEDSDEDIRNPLERVSDSFDRIIDTITNEDEKQRADELVRSGLNKIHDEN